MFVKAKTVFRASDGLATPGCVVEVDEKLGKRLVQSGAAVETKRPSTLGAAAAPLPRFPGENPSKGENTQNGPENAGNGQVTGYLDEAQLQEMSYIDLKVLAKDMGIETGKIKSKAGMIAAITAVEVQADAEDAPPVFDAQDVIDE